MRGEERSGVRGARADPRTEHSVMFGAEVADTTELPELAVAARSWLGFVQAWLEELQAVAVVKPGARRPWWSRAGRRCTGSCR